MRFFPETLPADWRAENEVWSTVQEVMADEEGVAWLGFPVYESHTPRYHAPDILILSRRYGVIVIECKGAWDRNIVAIHGQSWEMQDFYAEEITPVKQVEAQKFAVQNRIEKVLGRPCSMVFRTMVALPLISRAEWRFGEHPSTRPVTLAEDLCPVGFKAWLDCAQKEHPQEWVNNQEWSGIFAALGEPPPTNVDPPPVIDPSNAEGPSIRFVEYESKPPSNELLRHLLALPDPLDPTPTPEPDYWYLVPTAGLEHARSGLAPRTQLYERLNRNPHDHQESEARLLFRKAIQHLIEATGKWRIARRLDEVVHLRRAIDRVTLADEGFREQIRHDLYAWLDAFHELEERGLDLGTEKGVEESALAFVHREVAHLMGILQRHYHSELAGHGVQSFEIAARAFLLSADFHPPATVVMEGFTRLTELQKLFLERCSAHPGCTVVIIIPYVESQAEGFEAVSRTYDPYKSLPHTIDRRPGRGVQNPSTLFQLKRALFSSQQSAALPAGSSVMIRAFRTRQEEAGACVDAIAGLLQQDTPSRGGQGISVVTRDPAAYKVLLREEAAIRHPNKPLQFDLQPIQLLLTPVGRFVLGLYEVWKDGVFSIEASQFSRLLASGWLGQRVQASTSRFDALVPAFFSSSKTLPSWQEAFGHLGYAYSLTPVNSRIPSAGGTPEDIGLWVRALDSIHRLVEALFDGRQKTLAEHVRRLRDVLDREDTPDLQVEEREVVQQIPETLGAFAGTTDLDLHTEEFGEVLNALVREREQSEDHTRITVTGPESLDGLSKEFVFFLGVDEHRIPSGYAEPWPWADIDIQGHQAQERYLFLATVRAATEMIYLSYSEVDDRQGCRPSIYLEDVADLLSSPLVRPTEGVVLDSSWSSPGRLPHTPIHRTHYKWEEFAHFRLCPRRYKLERLSPGTRRYREKWQTQFVVQSVWYWRMLAHLKDLGRPIPRDLLEEEWLAAAGNSERQVHRFFPSLMAEDWYFIRILFLRQIRNQAEYYSKQLQSLDQCRVHDGVGRSVPVQVERRSVSVQVSVRHIVQAGRWNYDNQDLFREEWLLPALPADGGQDNGVLTDRYHAQQWGNKFQIGGLINPNGVGTKQGIEDIIRAVETDSYLPVPGDHCTFCPSSGLCLGEWSGGEG
jgi:hypothetical protein